MMMMMIADYHLYIMSATSTISKANQHVCYKYNQQGESARDLLQSISTAAATACLLTHSRRTTHNNDKLQNERRRAGDFVSGTSAGRAGDHFTGTSVGRADDFTGINVGRAGVVALAQTVCNKRGLAVRHS